MDNLALASGAESVTVDLEKPLDEAFLDIAVRLTVLRLQLDAKQSGISRTLPDTKSVAACLRRSLGVLA